MHTKRSSGQVQANAEVAYRIPFDPSIVYVTAESDLPELTSQLSNNGTTYTLFHHSKLLSMGGLDALLLAGNDSWLQRLHFLLLCTASRSSLMLKQVSLN